MTHPPGRLLPSVSPLNVCSIFPGRAARWMDVSCRLRRGARCRLTLTVRAGRFGGFYPLNGASYGEARDKLQAMRAAHDPRLGDACQ